MMIPEKKIRSMASEHWECETSSLIADQAVGFARLVEKKYERLRTIENTRMGCLANGGHNFKINGGFESIEGSLSEMVINGWRAVGDCENCDAQLTVSYREDS